MKMSPATGDGKTEVRTRHGRLLSGYLANLHRGQAPVREQMLADIDRFQSLGATAYADDLKIALKRFTSEFVDGKNQSQPIDLKK
jgi:hypothetical protein